MNPMIKERSASPQNASGFTLLELLVSIVIGMLAISSAITVLSNASAQRKLLKYSADLREEAFMISHVLSQQIAQIGYQPLDQTRVASRILPLATKEVAFPEVSGVWAAGQTIRGDATSITYRFQGASLPDGTPDNTMFDCHGNALPAGTVYEVQIEFRDAQLHCISGGETAVLVGLDDRLSVDQVLFEVGIDDDTNGEIDRQLTVQAATDAELVNASQLGVKLLIASKDNVAAYEKDYRFDDVAYTAADRKLRVSTDISMALRN